jgi:hypothetical protein
MAPKSEEIVTVFATEPSKIDTSLTKMPRAETPAEILPTLLMSPVKVVTSLTSMPVEPAAILPAPLLTMSPEKSEAFSTKMIDAVGACFGYNRAAVGYSAKKSRHGLEKNAGESRRDRAAVRDAAQKSCGVHVNAVVARRNGPAV